MRSPRWAWLDSHEADTGWRGLIIEAALIGVGALVWLCGLAPWVQLALGSRAGYLPQTMPAWVLPWLLIVAGHVVGRVTRLDRRRSAAKLLALVAFAALASAVWLILGWHVIGLPLSTWGGTNSWIAITWLVGTAFPLTGIGWCLRSTDQLDTDSHRLVVTGSLAMQVIAWTAVFIWAWFLRTPTIADMIHSLQWSVPTWIVASLTLLGVGQFRTIRDASASHHLRGPRWYRLMVVLGLTVVGVMVLTMIAFVLTGRNALDVFIVVGQVALAALFIVVGAITFLASCVYFVWFWLWGTITGRRNTPREFALPTGREMATKAVDAGWAGWVGIGVLFAILVAIALGAITIYRRHRAQATGEKENIFSLDLLQSQLRGDDTTRPTPLRRRRITLDDSPRDAREAMVYLQTLARRHGLERHPWESAEDFVLRLARQWDDVAQPLRALAAAYVTHRYGDLPHEATSAWRMIWKAHHA